MEYSPLAPGWDRWFTIGMTLAKKQGWLLLALLVWAATTGMFAMPGLAMASTPLTASHQPMACDTQAHGSMTVGCDPAPQGGMASCCLPSSCPGLLMVGPALMQVATASTSALPFFPQVFLPDSPSERLYRPPRI